MKNLILLSLFVSVPLLGVPSNYPTKIKGALLLSPAELQSFELSLEKSSQCKAESIGHLEITTCPVSNSKAFFEGKEGKSEVVFQKVTEFKQKKLLEPEKLLRSYTLLGKWQGTSNGFEVNSGVVLALYEYATRPGEFTGYFEFRNSPYSRISVAARAQ